MKTLNDFKAEIATKYGHTDWQSLKDSEHGNPELLEISFDEANDRYLYYRENKAWDLLIELRNKRAKNIQDADGMDQPLKDSLIKELDLLLLRFQLLKMK